MRAILHMPRLMFTVGVESYSSKKPQDADYLKPSWLFYLIVNHSVDWITAFYKTHHCAKMSGFSFCFHSKWQVCGVRLRRLRQQESPSNSFTFKRQ